MVVIILIVTLVYIFPVLSRFSMKKVSEVFKTALMMGVRHFLFNFYSKYHSSFPVSSELPSDFGIYFLNTLSIRKDINKQYAILLPEKKKISYTLQVFWEDGTQEEIIDPYVQNRQ